MTIITDPDELDKRRDRRERIKVNSFAVIERGAKVGQVVKVVYVGFGGTVKVRIKPFERRSRANHLLVDLQSLTPLNEVQVIAELSRSAPRS